MRARRHAPNKRDGAPDSIFDHEFSFGNRDKNRVTLVPSPTGFGGAGGNARELMERAKNGDESARRQIGLKRPGDPGFNEAERRSDG